LLNLDSEDDEEITIGCAGGIDLTATKKYEQEKPGSNHLGFRITVKGLKGGHSGMDIHLGRGNANKLLNRVLWTLSKSMPLRISRFDGGGLRNAIPREAFALIAVPMEEKGNLEATIEELQRILHNEYQTTDPQLALILEREQMLTNCIKSNDQTNLLNALYACQNGIYRMSPDVKDLVQTSNNLARVLVADGEIKILCLTRGAVDSEKDDLANNLESCFNLMGAVVKRAGSYPGWAPDPNAKVNQLLADTYVKMFNHTPAIMACHAGLECGIIKKAYPDVDMISFGPNIRGAHSPDERVQISSVQKFWKLLLKVLEQM